MNVTELAGLPPAHGSLGRRAARGAVILLLRTATVRAVGVVGSIALARLLTPRDYGVYAIAAFCVAFLGTFSDVGLGGAIIQKQTAPTRADLTTVFTVQVTLATLLVVAGLVVSGPISHAYGLDDSSAWLIRALLASLLLGTLRTIPAVMLERELGYGRLGIAEAVEAVTFQVAAVTLAFLGFGVWSFVWAALTRAIAGLAVFYAVAPWRPGLGVSRAALRPLLSFGFSYQLQGILGFIKDSMTPTITAVVAGAAAVGYLNWAYSVATIPLIITGALWQVTFPAFSRAASDRRLLTTMVERSIKLSAIVLLPLSFLIVAAGPSIVNEVYTDRWSPALTAVYLFSAAIWTGPLIGATFFSLFYATGHGRYALTFTVVYGVLDWGIGVPLLYLVGFEGIAVRSVIVAYLTLPALILVARSILPVRTVSLVAAPAVVAAISALTTWLILRLVPASRVDLAIALAVGSALYAALIVIVERRPIAQLIELAAPSAVQHRLQRYLRIQPLPLEGGRGA